MVKNTEDFVLVSILKELKFYREFLTKEQSYGIYYGNWRKSHRF